MEQKKDIDIIEEYWDNRSETFDEDHATEDIDLWREELDKLCERKKGLKCLDIGTGTGFLAIMLAELGHEVTGIDISEKMMELGKQHAAERGVDVTFVKGEGEKMPFEDDTFDVIVNCRVLWTLTDPSESFKEWLRVLKPGGKMLAFMRAHTEEKREWNAYDGELESDLPLRNATKEQYFSYLDPAGFKNTDVIPMPPNLTVKKETKDGHDMQPWECVYGEKA